MLPLPPVTWWRFFLWLAAGMILYWGAGMDQSKLATSAAAGQSPQWTAGKLLVIGLLLKVFGAALAAVVFFGQASGKEMSIALKIALTVAGFVAYVGLVLWVRGCGKYSFSKGYSHWWGTPGLLGPPWLAILYLLPQKSQTTSKL
jgi:hypothetical protein